MTPTANREARYRAASGATFAALGECREVDCPTFTRVEVTVGAHELELYCIAHRSRLLFARLRATLDAGIECNPSCRLARHPVCRCSCAGANHAKGSQ